MFPLINDSVVLPSVLVKGKFFAQRFSKNSNLHESGILLLAFRSRNNLKLHNILIFSIILGLLDQLHIL